MRVTMYGKEWEVDTTKGQVGLLEENHYAKLFAFPFRSNSFQQNDRWLDIGANIGSFAIRAADFVECVVAYEPEPDNLLCLRGNLALNHVTNVEVVEAAVVGGVETSVPLALSNSFSSTHRVGTVRGRKTIEVPAHNINVVLKEHRINKIKMDCEGSELGILRVLNYSGIEEIIFEYHFSFLKDEAWASYFEFLDDLKEEGFTILRGVQHNSKTWHTIVWAKKL